MKAYPFHPPDVEKGDTYVHVSPEECARLGRLVLPQPLDTDAVAKWWKALPEPLRRAALRVAMMLDSEIENACQWCCRSAHGFPEFEVCGACRTCKECAADLDDCGACCGEIDG